MTIKEYIVCAKYENETVCLGLPFTEKDLEEVKKKIQVPVVSVYKTFQPEEMWIEDYLEWELKQIK